MNLLSYSTAVDVYSWGVILLQLVTGLPPLIKGVKGTLPKNLPEFMRGNSPAVVGAAKGDARVWRWAAAKIPLGPSDPDGSLVGEQVVEALLKLGMHCTESNRKDRPRIKDVVEVLATLAALANQGLVQPRARF